MKEINKFNVLEMIIDYEKKYEIFLFFHKDKLPLIY